MSLAHKRCKVPPSTEVAHTLATCIQPTPAAACVWRACVWGGINARIVLNLFRPHLVLSWLLQSCRLMYDLPSGEADVSGTLVDLFDDEDLEMMWEEMDVMLVRSECCAQP